MRRVDPRPLLVLVALLLVGCATSGATSGPTRESSAAATAPAEGASSMVELTRVGEAVQVTEDAESTHECEFVVHLPLSSTRVSDVNALRTLRNEAGRSGANLVLLVMESRTRIARAEGYLCAD